MEAKIEAPPERDDSQLFLFDLEEPWRIAWRGMPEYILEDLTPRYQVIVSFESAADVAAFAKLLGQTVLPTTRSLWYPEQEIGRYMDKRYAQK